MIFILTLFSTLQLYLVTGSTDYFFIESYLFYLLSSLVIYHLLEIRFWLLTLSIIFVFAMEQVKKSSIALDVQDALISMDTGTISLPTSMLFAFYCLAFFYTLSHRKKSVT